jgi:hypothetical protein
MDKDSATAAKYAREVFESPEIEVAEIGDWFRIVGTGTKLSSTMWMSESGSSSASVEKSSVSVENRSEVTNSVSVEL